MEQLTYPAPWTALFKIVGVLLMVGGVIGFVFGLLILIREARSALSNLLSPWKRWTSNAPSIPPAGKAFDALPKSGCGGSATHRNRALEEGEIRS